MKVSKLDHVAIVCSDVNQSKDWYIQVLEMEWVHQGMWNGRPVFLKKGDFYLALFQASTSESATDKGPRYDHFALCAETMADYRDCQKRLKDKGIQFQEEDHDISYSSYFKDPDGLTVEITTYDL